MGIPGQFNRAELTAAIELIRETGRMLGCPAGIHIVEPDPARLAQVISEGFTLIAYSVDIRVLDVGMRTGVQAAKQLRR